MEFIAKNAEAIAYIASGLLALAVPLGGGLAVRFYRRIKIAVKALEDGKLTAEEIKQILNGGK
jgi:hypothetical protein